MAFKLPNGAIFSIENAPGASKVVSVLTNAADAVATLPVGHGVVVGDVVVLASGWAGVDGLGAVVLEVDVNDVTLGGVNTSDVGRYPAGVGIGSLRVVIPANMTQLSQVLTVASSGGEQQYRTISPLEQDNDVQLPTNRTPRTMTLTLGDDPSKAWNATLKAANADQIPRAIVLRLRGGDRIVYVGYISFDGVPTVTKNEEMTVPLNIALVGTPLRYQAA